MPTEPPDPQRKNITPLFIGALTPGSQMHGCALERLCLGLTQRVSKSESLRHFIHHAKKSRMQLLGVATQSIQHIDFQAIALTTLVGPFGNPLLASPAVTKQSE